MKVCGVIAEYDPFHRGHARHLMLAREKCGADQMICVMSGSFTQRGAPALLPASVRAEMALRGGADIVLQLPFAFSVREAERFALGGVSILNALKCVDFISFGCECDDLGYLQAAAEKLEYPDERFSAVLHGELAKGASYAAAGGKALEESLPGNTGILARPNTALALCYLRALTRLKSPIIPVPVLRENAYHESELEAYPSATAVRGAMLRGDWQGIQRAVPLEALPVLEKAVLEKQIFRPESMDLLLRKRLLSLDAEALRKYPGVGEGLEMRILKAAQSTVSREALIDEIKTRRYTRGRISRALCHIALGAESKDLPRLPAYTRILGFRESARPLLRMMQKSGFPLVTRPARENGMELDIRADEVWALGAGIPRGDTYRRGPVIVRE